MVWNKVPKSFATLSRLVRPLAERSLCIIFDGHLLKSECGRGCLLYSCMRKRSSCKTCSAFSFKRAAGVLATRGNGDDWIWTTFQKSVNSLSLESPNVCVYLLNKKINERCLLCWHVAVICHAILLKLTEIVFTSLPLRTLWPNRLNFFHLSKKFGLWHKKNPDCTDLETWVFFWVTAVSVCKTWVWTIFKTWSSLA